MNLSLPAPLWPWGAFFVASGKKHGIDPALLAAIAWRESKGNQHAQGSDGHGRGLMQIDDRYHPKFCSTLLEDGHMAWEDPASSVDYAAAFLAGLMQDFLCEPRLAPFADLLGVAAYNAGHKRVSDAVEHLTDPLADEAVIRAADSVTTGKEYVTYVMARRAIFATQPFPLKENS